MIKNTDNLNQYKNERFLNFYKKYEKEITPYIGKYEKERIKEICKLIILPTIVILILALYQFNMVLAIAIYGGFFIFRYFKNKYFCENKKFQSLVKKDLLPKILGNIEGISWSSSKTTISDETIRKSQLFESYNIRENDDAFTGEYKGVTFKVSETNLSSESGSGDDHTVSNVFKGIIILIDSNKEIKAHTKIQPKMDKKTEIICTLLLVFLWGSLLYYAISSESYFISCIFLFSGTISIISLFSHSNKEMNLEDPDFNKKYIVTTKDQIEGRYLITTGFMDRFKNLQTAFGTKNVKCAFFDNKIMFALHTNKDFFELSGGLFHSLKHPKQVKSFYEETTAIYDIIDYFKLDEKTGL